MNSPLPPNLFISIHREVINDYEEINNFALEEISYKLIKKLSTGGIRGIRLQNHPEIGNLSDCFKLYFDLTTDVTPRFRIVFTYMPSSTKPEELIVLAVGERESLKVYRKAFERRKDFT